MKVTTVPITGSTGVVREPFVRRSAQGGGCPAGKCSCSPGFWLSVSNGSSVIKVEFDTEAELEAAIAAGSDAR